METSKIAGKYFLEGCLREQEGELKKAVQAYKWAAMLGDFRAMNSLAVCYREGLGVQPSLAKARWWFRMGAIRDPEAQYNYGCLVEAKGKWNMALKWYQKAGSQGVRQGAYNASDIFLRKNEEIRTRCPDMYNLPFKERVEMEANMDQWRDWAHKAAMLGDTDALLRLRTICPEEYGIARVPKCPRIFIGYSASRSEYWRDYITSSFVPFLQQKNIDYYSYLETLGMYSNRDRESTSINRRDMGTQFSGCDVYIRFVDANTPLPPTRLFESGVPAGTNDNSAGLPERDHYFFEQAYSLNFFRSRLSQMIVVRQGGDFPDNLHEYRQHEDSFDVKVVEPDQNFDQINNDILQKTDEQSAKDLFRKALELNPFHKKAQEQLHVLCDVGI